MRNLILFAVTLYLAITVKDGVSGVSNFVYTFSSILYNNNNNNTMTCTEICGRFIVLGHFSATKEERM